MPKSFDPFSKQYNVFADQAIRISGYDTQTLVDAKLKKLKSLYPALAKKSFCLLDYGCELEIYMTQLKNFFQKLFIPG